MGCDGGTIPKRNEIVKNKQKDQGRDKNADLSAKWQFCSLSGLRLKKPIVACQLGRLYNKDAIIEYLLESKTSSSNANTSSHQSLVSHIKSLKDVKELKLKEKADFDKAHQASSGSEQFKAQFVCPISNLDINGKYKFYYLLTCGCVLSERALKEVPDEKQCILCSKPYYPDSDLIVLNGDEEETTELRQRRTTRKRQQMIAKRSLQTSGVGKDCCHSSLSSGKESTTNNGDLMGESSSKRHKSETKTTKVK